MSDRYRNFADLAADQGRDVDFRVRSADRATKVVIIAPHGGSIEPETSEIAEAIAGDELSFYTFEGLRSGAYGDLHITSHRFDEPVALALVGMAETSVAIHGRKDDGTDTVWLGGRATLLRDAIGASLRNSGFLAELNTRLPGLNEANICNRTRTGEGVQLELPRSLRRRLAVDRRDLEAFCLAIQNGIS